VRANGQSSEIIGQNGSFRADSALANVRILGLHHINVKLYTAMDDINLAKNTNFGNN
jgi:hypothetical protein